MDFNIDKITYSMPDSKESQAEWEQDASHFAPFMTYTDRESYLEWVKAWKAQYAGLTEAQRATKAKVFPVGFANADDKDIAALHHQRRLARAMLALRRHAKADSWAKRQAAKAETTAA